MINSCCNISANTGAIECDENYIHEIKHVKVNQDGVAWHHTGRYFSLLDIGYEHVDFHKRIAEHCTFAVTINRAALHGVI